jgi:phage shock protein C
MGEPRRLYRDVDRGVLAGICAGLGEFLDVDTMVVRVGTVLLAVFTAGLPAVAYLAMWVLVPRRPSSAPAPPPATSPQP